MLVAAFPDPCVGVAVAVVAACDVELAIRLVEVSEDAATGLTTGVMEGMDVADAWPGPSRAERLLLAFADKSDAGNVASGEAVRGTLKIVHI